MCRGKRMNKIDLIIDALEKAKDGWQCFDEYEQALAAAKKLRVILDRTKTSKDLCDND